MELNEREFRDATKHGCVACQVQAEVLEDYEMVWIDPQSFICSECFDNDMEHLSGLNFN